MNKLYQKYLKIFSDKPRSIILTEYIFTIQELVFERRKILEINLIKIYYLLNWYQSDFITTSDSAIFSMQYPAESFACS